MTAAVVFAVAMFGMACILTSSAVGEAIEGDGRSLRRAGRDGVGGSPSGGENRYSAADRAADRIEPNSLDQTQAAQLALRAARTAQGGLKRLFDIVAALATLVLLAPVYVLAAMAIRLDTKGPVLYRQARVGLNGEIFSILKFRSMIIDAEQGGVQWACKKDPRVTRVGAFIRFTRIDELPQAINVLSGEMSFVGPRPERPEFVKILEREIPNYAVRHAVKPGITGWAQVSHEYGASVADAHEKLKYDLFYMRRFDVLFDLYIVLKTVRVALFGIGAR